MKQVERRIHQLEKIFFPESKKDYLFVWEEFLLFLAFRQSFPDPDDAPEHLRRPYLLLHERWLRGIPIRERWAAKHRDDDAAAFTAENPANKLRLQRDIERFLA